MELVHLLDPDMEMCRFSQVFLFKDFFFKFISAILSVLMTIIGLFLLILITWFYLAYESIPCLVKNNEQKEYDFIIVGAGTAGCVLAHELTSLTNSTVLLVEAGSNFGPLSIVPITTTLMQGTNLDWSFKTVSQKYSSKGLVNEQQSWPRGKGLGGSSQMNYMLHFDGMEKDFKRWEQLGAKDWGFDKLMKFEEGIKECDEENQICRRKTVKRNIPIIKFNELMESKLANAFLESGEDLNLYENEFVNYELIKYTIKNGTRWNVYQEYLKPSFSRKNLHILVNTRVHRILFTGNRATSILISSEGYLNKFYKMRARKEIILCLGAIQTPQLLKLSGIGPKEELTKHGINVLYDSPTIGTNLFDHLNFPIFVSIKEKESITKDKILSLKEWYNYIKNGKGVLSNPGVIGAGRIVNQDFAVVLFGMGSADEKALKDIANFKKDAFRSIFPFYYNSSQEGFIFISTCFQPKSRGTIKLKSVRITTPPSINPKYLQKKEDVKCMIDGIRIIAKTIRQRSFKELGARIHWPKLSECSNFGPFSNDYLTNQPSDRYLECILRIGALTAHHPGGTVAIGLAVKNKLQ